PNPSIQDSVIAFILADWPSSDFGETLFLNYVLTSNDEAIKFLVLQELKYQYTKSAITQKLILQGLNSSNVNLVVASLEYFEQNPFEINSEVIKFLTQQLSQDANPVLRHLSASILTTLSEDNKDYKVIVESYNESELY